MASNRICIAKITTAHGIRGLVKMHVYSDDISLVNGTLYTSESGSESLTITLKNATSKHWLAEIEGVTDRNQSEILRGTMLYIERESLPNTNKNEFYISDLIGLPAINVNGDVIGKIIDVANFGAGDLLEIKPLNTESFYLPFNDDTILEVSENSTTIELPKGLLED